MKSLTTFFYIIVACIIPSLLYAQPDPPGGPVPIDGGIGVLLALGAAYGLKKYALKKEDE
jgi:hypothetical protein